MIIYKTINIINNFIYIGQDKNNNPNYYGSGLILNNAIKKYGKENFKKEILEYCNSKEQLNQKEIYWINFYNSTNRNIGYNITMGGSGGDTISKHPDRNEIVRKISIANKGKLIGYKHTEETKLKNSLAHKGKKQTEESNLKRSLKTKGISKPWKNDRIVTEETKEKISFANKGNKNGNAIFHSPRLSNGVV